MLPAPRDFSAPGPPSGYGQAALGWNQGLSLRLFILPPVSLPSVCPVTTGCQALGNRDAGGPCSG